MFKKALIAVLIFFLSPITLFAQTVSANFDAGLLISDEAFVDTATFGGSAGVQQFLQSRGSVLANTSAEFLVKLREPADTSLKTRLDDPNPSLGRARTAAELIYDAAVSAGLNPQVLVVTLQKEQTLITKNFTSNDDLQRALDRALGYGCPDGSPCQASFLGFYNQLFGTFDAAGERWIGAAKSLVRSFNTEINGVKVGRGPLIDGNSQAFGSGPFVRASRTLDVIVMENTLNGFSGVQPTQQVTLRNRATAALYRYTPHVFNGNYNFWRFYQEWFRYPNGTVLALNGQQWVVDNGLRRTFSSFVAGQRGLNLAGAITVSPTELSFYPEGDRLVPKDGTLIRSDITNISYYIEAGKKHKITDFTAQQRNLNLSTAVTLSDSEVQSYATGDNLLPLEGTLLRADGDNTVYVMSGSTRRPLTFTIFQQRKYSFAKVVVLSATEVAEIPAGNIMPPLDGTIVRAANGGIFLVENGAKRWYSAAVFQQRRLTAGKALNLVDEEIAAMPEGLPVSPLDNTLVKTADNPTVYTVWKNTRIPISYNVFIMRGFNKKPIMILSQVEIEALALDPHALPPKDGTLLRAEGDNTVYLVQKEQLRPLTYQAFVNRRFRFSQVVVLAPDEINLFEKGEVIVK